MNPSRSRLPSSLLTLLTLLALLVLPQPADAATSAISLRAPAAVAAGVAVPLRGRVARQAHVVRVERRAHGRWVLVRRAAVRHGRYATTVRQSAPRARYRVVHGHGAHRAVSPVRAVRLAPSTDRCGVRPAKADGSLWSCTFADDFSGTSLDRTKWLPQTKFTSGTAAAHACYLDDPSTIGVANGSLNLTLRKVSTPVSCSYGGTVQPSSYVSGSVMTYHLFAQQYGRFEARIKNTALPASGGATPGLQETFWLWPDDRVPSTVLWPYAGEIDISETYSSYPNLAIPFLHYAADAFGPQPGTNTAWNCTAYRGVWNTYTLDWSATRLEIKVNGRTCLVNTSGDPAFQKPYIMALSQLMGANGNVYDGRAPLPATMNVDYVRVWK